METILFLIIAGILSTIFRKAKGKEKPGRTKPFTAKSFDDIRTLFEQPKINVPKNTEQMTTGQPVNNISSRKTIEEKYQQVKKEHDVNPISEIYLHSIDKSEQVQVLTDEPDEKTLINGIIWAEILGPPRAKRPYSAKKS